MTRNLMQQLDQIVEIDMENLNIHFVIKQNWCIGANKGGPMTRSPIQLSCCIDKKHLMFREFHPSGISHKRRIMI